MITKSQSTLLISVIIAVFIQGISARAGTFATQAEDSEPTLYPVGIAGKWGYIDRGGKITIQPSFDYAGDFYEGLAVVAKDREYERPLPGKYGYIDRAGNIVIAMKFESAGPFHEGLAAVQLGGRYGFIDKSGQFVVRLQFDNVGMFSEGLAPVRIGAAGADGKWGYIDRSGDLVIQPLFVEARGFREGMAAVFPDRSEDKWGFIDKLGNMVIEPRFTQANDFSEGLAAVQAEVEWEPQGHREAEAREWFRSIFGATPVVGKWGFIDKSGKVVIPFAYDQATSFSEGLAMAGSHDSVNIIDQKGNIAIPLKLRWAETFHEGLTWAVLEDRKGVLLATDGHTISAPKGFYGSRGFYQGLSRVEDDSGRMGYVNSEGKFVWQPTQTRMPRPSRVPVSVEGPLTAYVKTASVRTLDSGLPDESVESWLRRVVGGDYVTTWAQGDCGLPKTRITIAVPVLERVCIFSTLDRGFGRQVELILAVAPKHGRKKKASTVVRVRFHTDMDMGEWVELAHLRDLEYTVRAKQDRAKWDGEIWRKTYRHMTKDRQRHEKTDSTFGCIKRKHGMTALMTAAQEGDIRKVSKLIAHGAEVNAASIDCAFRIHGGPQEGKTALMFAAENGHLEVARALLEHGADLAVEDTMYGSAWMYAAKNGHTEILQLLWDKLVGKIDQHTIIASFPISCSVYHKELIHFLAIKVENPAHLARVLACVISGGDEEMVSILLSLGAHVHADAITAAASAQTDNFLKLMLDTGASIDMRMMGIGNDIDDSTPLMIVARAGNAIAVQRLIKFGANVSAIDARGRSVLSYAQQQYGPPRDNSRVIQLLEQASAH